ncbi:hypothetical protein EG240_15660 [Paenimyroides tangerinum]|uniref:Uncharacterized protein n=1 Tax=Paenimyroides tangerinum TaxID=2488728 RepID=A0A3P3VW52_9FLAO|nr:hypothetical protein [Paenimyroides tangerinum]RRJ86920.1 hypothetical protein EG240_15660 [Paenimyroides tangerinum]
MIFFKNKIIKCSLTYFGPSLIQINKEETCEQIFNIPFTFYFNHSWNITHKCSCCDNSVTIINDVNNNFKNYTTISNLNSNNYDILFLQELASLFSNIILAKVDNVVYLNRKDFKYEFDFQRKQSVSLKGYTCKSCNASYLGILRIGMPILPEKSMQEGMFGSVEIEEIIEVDISEDIF